MNYRPKRTLETNFQALIGLMAMGQLRRSPSKLKNNLNHVIRCSLKRKNLLHSSMKDLSQRVTRINQGINLIRNITINIRRIKSNRTRTPNLYLPPKQPSLSSKPLSRIKKNKTPRIKRFQTPPIKSMP